MRPFAALTRFFRAGPPAPIRRSLDAASGARRAGGMGHFLNTSSEVAAAAAVVRSRARYQRHNNGWIGNAVSNWTGALVGSGIRPAPRLASADDRRAVSVAFETWADDADLGGRLDLWGIQRLVADHLVTDGEALVILHDDSEGLRLQVVPPEHLDESKTVRLSDGRSIVNGVEFDATGARPVAYWILPDAETSQLAGGAPSVRVDAADVCHVFDAKGAGQVRGLSWLAPAIIPANELDQLQDALLVAAKTAAMFAGFVTDPNATGPAFDGDLTDISLEPGVVRVLPAGTDIKFTGPEQAKDAGAFLRHNLQGLAAALGLPEHLLSGDLTGANYSSLRAGLLPFRARVEAIQYTVLVPQFLRRVWQRWLALEIASGRLDAPADIRCDWIMPRPLQVDPQKDLEALKTALELGLTSRSAAINELGWNADDLDRDIAADRAREAELGLTFTPKAKESANG